MPTSPLQSQLQPIKRRLWLLGTAAALVGAIIATILFILLGGWLDLVWELAPEGRIAFLTAAGLIGTTVFVVAVVRVAKQGRPSLLAQRIDRTMNFGGALLTGCELETTFRAEKSRTATLAHIAVEHAVTLAATTVPKKAVPAEQTQQLAIVLTSLIGFVGLLALLLPEMMQTQWNRFLYPYSDVPRFSNTIIEIIDPDKRVLYGDPLDIRAAVRGEPLDAATLVLETESGTTETLPMFPESDSHWRANIAKVTENAVYHVRADRARSTMHSISVIMIPRIENVRFRTTPPPYTHRPALEGPLPREGLSGLPGTKIEVRATSNRPLSRGEISVTTGPNDPVTIIEMVPVESGGTEVIGEFAITASGKFELQIFDEGGLGSRDKFSGGITLLKDERPMIRIIKPSARSLATPSVTLPVEIAAEDDYGIARVQLFRSLNDSRFLPTDLPLSDVPPRRFNGQIDLPLHYYDLKPGDVVKLFARVEDNDPDGPQGAESSVVVVEIISQEQFEQMLRMQNGMEMMLSRYREALRRLETVADEMDILQQKLAQLNPDDPITDEIKQELAKLTDRLQKEAEAIRKLAQNPLPYDLDKKLAEELDKAAKLAEDAAESVDKLLAGGSLSNKSVQDKLGELADELAVGKKSFDEATMPPLELLALILPLKQDENRFVELVLHQKDLADRLSSLKDRDKEDDPAVKARMRELEDEQREIQEALNSLLDDIEEHAKALPDTEEFNKLHDTAMRFARDVRKSGANEAMTEAQTGLAEYSGTVGYAKALEAADILERFLAQCGGMGDCATQCLGGFQPRLGNSLNQTLEQLLRDRGFGSGMMGAGHGISAQRGGPNVGLYGMLPGMSAFADIHGSGKGGQHLGGKGGAGGKADADADTGYEISVEGTVSGTGEGAIPLRYRQAVGRYFQRIIED